MGMAWVFDPPNVALYIADRAIVLAPFARPPSPAG
jgi:hypothetical protein